MQRQGDEREHGLTVNAKGSKVKDEVRGGAAS